MGAGLHFFLSKLIKVDKNCVSIHMHRYLNFGPAVGEGPIRYPLYVCLSVCLYVCDSCPALTTPTNFLIFGMKVGDH